MPFDIIGDIGRLSEKNTTLSGDKTVTFRDGSAFLTNGVKFDNTVVVKDAFDLETIDSTKNYMIDGVVDMGSTPIIVPEGGISISGLNGARDTAKLISSADNYSMFISPDGGYSGNVVLESCTIDVTGTNSQVFNLDNDENSGALDITGVNFGQSPVTRTTSLGHLSNYRQLLLNNVGFIFINDGLTFNGAWTGIAVLTSIAVGFPSATLFKEGTSFTVGNVRSDVNFLSVQSDSVLFDFDNANITDKGGFALSNVRVGSDDAIPNITSNDVKTRFRNCQGFRNTYIGGQWTITSAATTNIAAANTPVKLAGTTTYNDLTHFTGDNSNEFVYIGDQNIEVEAKGVVSITGGNNDQISVFFRKWDDSASAYVDGPRVQATLNGGLLGTRAEGIPFFGYFSLDNNDRIEVWVENNTDTTNVTANLNGLVALSERAS